MGAKPGTTTPATRRAQSLEDAWREALLREDEPALRGLLHPEYKLIGMRASGMLVVGVDRWMAALATMDIASVNARVLDAIEVDRTLVCSVDACWNVRYRGQTIEERVLLTDVFVKTGDQWQALRRHSSLAPSGVDIALPK